MGYRKLQEDFWNDKNNWKKYLTDTISKCIINKDTQTMVHCPESSFYVAFKKFITSIHIKNLTIYMHIIIFVYHSLLYYYNITILDCFSASFFFRRHYAKSLIFLLCIFRNRWLNPILLCYHE